jgi:hypothetical protein
LKFRQKQGIEDIFERDYEYERLDLISENNPRITKGNFKLDVYKDDKYLTSIGHKDYKDYATYLEEYGKDYADERRRLYKLRHKKEGVRGQLASAILW